MTNHELARRLEALEKDVAELKSRLPQPNAQLERRLAALEKEMAATKQQLAQPADGRQRSWFEDTGRFADDPVFDDVVRLGRKYRESLRPRSRESAR